MKVNIYCESDIRTQGQKERTVMYLLECRINEVPITKYGLFMRLGSFNECILEGFIKALKRVKYPCEITFFTANSLLLDLIRYHLPGWAVQDFRKKSGEEITNRDLWMEFHARAHKHEIETSPGHHEYRTWMLEEIRRHKEEGGGRNDEERTVS